MLYPRIFFRAAEGSGKEHMVDETEVKKLELSSDFFYFRNYYGDLPNTSPVLASC